jgi:hypothetical protein
MESSCVLSSGLELEETQRLKEIIKFIQIKVSVK